MGIKPFSTTAETGDGENRHLRVWPKWVIAVYTIYTNYYLQKKLIIYFKHT